MVYIELQHCLTLPIVSKLTLENIGNWRKMRFVLFFTFYVFLVYGNRHELRLINLRGMEAMALAMVVVASATSAKVRFCFFFCSFFLLFYYDACFFTNSKKPETQHKAT
ncbi:unnamed protein product [Vicia faba]|uniref:Uncharacterized protein n=1 Tax=Vicia faba TaxID=3906 RepID=A0AAV0ZDG9_VICFA|nr:unnamed protein product [Vicia faba]